MIEEIIVDENVSRTIIGVVKKTKYKTTNGKIYDNKKEAEEEQEYLDVYERIPKIEPCDDEVFIQEGTFYYFKNFRELGG